MFKFKGISSTDMKVVVEEEDNFIARAAQRYEIIETEGKDSAQFDTLGYSYIERPITIQCIDISKIDSILSWLNGEGEFEYNGRKTIARFFEQQEPQRNSCIRIIKTNFIRDPFWNKVDDEFTTIDDIVINKGNIESRPIIRLEKNLENKNELTIGGIRFIYTFQNNEEYVEIDCEEKTITYEGLNRNRQMEIDYNFPKLNIGENQIIKHQGDCTIKMKRKDRWL